MSYLTPFKRFLPLLLIGLGVLLLLSSVGWLRLNLGALLQLWPLLLIATGVDILLRGRYRVAVVLTSLVAALLYTGGAGGGGAVGPGPAGTYVETVAQPLGGARAAAVHLQVGVSELRLDASGEPGMLVAGTVQAARNERITQSFRVTGGTARFTLRSRARGGFGVSGRRVWELSLTPSVPLALTVSTGVGRSSLNLTDAQLTRLSVSTGVGATELSLPSTGRYAASLDTGVGAATVRLPVGVAAQLEVSRGAGAVSVRGDFLREGDRYLSPGYETADNRVDLRISGGVGAITVEQAR